MYSVSGRKPDLTADIEDVSDINVPLLLHALCTETMKHMCKHGCLDASFSCFGPFEQRRSMCVQRFCIHCGLPYEILLCLNMMSLSVKCDVTVAVQVVFHRIGSCTFTDTAAVRISFGRARSDEAAVRQLFQDGFLGHQSYR